MYCHQCGQQLPEEAAYCPACGTKVIYEEQNTENTISAAPTSPTPAPPLSAASLPTEYFPGNLQLLHLRPKHLPRKKAKPGVKAGVLSAIGMMIVAAAIFVVLSWNSVDYVAFVKAFQPFNSQGMPYTYGQVLDKYIEDAKWSAAKREKNSDLLTTVEVYGSAKGIDQETKLSIGD